MRVRVAATLALLVALAVPAAAAARAPAGVAVKSCRESSDQSERAGTYRAWMDAVPGSERMAMRFVLVARRPGERSQRISSEQLNRWHRSDAGVTRFRYRQTVKGLVQGTSYRMRVSFRWYDADGQVIERARRWSGGCTGGPLPNLKVVALSWSRTASGNARYTVTVENAGDGDAAAFKVTLFRDGALVDERSLDRLRAGRSRTVDLNGPPCGRLRAVVDRGNAVVETREDDNSLRARCP